jgi:crossover junction endodeoxyribonuclease RuvC
MPLPPTRRVLGIDPGSHHLGIGCVQKCGNRLELVFADVIDAPSKEGFYERLDTLLARLRVIIEELSPDEVAVEDIFHGVNPRSAHRLGIARGVAVAACLGRGIKIYEYPPATVKSVVTGSGRADKTQVKKMVHLILGTTVEKGFDATDAIAVAICHAHSVAPIRG